MDARQYRRSWAGSGGASVIDISLAQKFANAFVVLVHVVLIVWVFKRRG